MCSNKKTTERQLMPKSEWIKRLEGRNIEILEFGKDVNDNSTLFKCLVPACESEWRTTFDSVGSRSKPTGCPNCGLQSRSNKLRLKQSDYEDVVKDKFIKILIFGSRVNKPETLFKCLNTKDGTVCSHEWYGRISDVRNGHGCPKCGNAIKVTLEEWKDRLRGRSVEIVKFSGTGISKSVFKCLKCNNNWTASVCTVWRSTGCPNCSITGFKPSKPGWLYVLLIDTPKGYCYGFGITNHIEDRMSLHKRFLKRANCTIVNIFEPLYFDSGYDAKLIEDRWKKSEFKINIGVKGFQDECLIMCNETTKMIFG
jgi:hypothetical protein